jgi:glucans biosynthesis protein
MTDDPMNQCTGVHSAEPQTLQHARRCGARTRSGRPCRSPAVHGRPRCRMHGCAPGAGGPEGERNGNYRHGFYTKETRGRLRAMRDLTREVRDLTRKLRGGVRSGKSEVDGPR